MYITIYKESNCTTSLLCRDDRWANVTKSTADCYHVVNGDLSLCGGLAEGQRDGGLKNSVLIPHQANDSLHMDPHGCKSPSCLQLQWMHMLLAFGKGWYFQLSTIQKIIFWWLLMLCKVRHKKLLILVANILKLEGEWDFGNNLFHTCQNPPLISWGYKI